MALTLPNRRVVFAAGGLVLLVVLVFVVRALIGSLAQPSQISVSGIIEATESDVSPKVQGRLIDLRVQDGDAVKKGQVVAVLERVDPSLDRAQAAANVQTAQAQLRVAQAAYDVQSVSYQTTLAQANEGVSIARSRLGQAAESYGIEQHTATLDVDQARAALYAAQSTYDKAKVDLDRATSLASTGDIPRQGLDDATADYKTASAQLQTATDGLNAAVAGLHTIQVRRLDVSASAQAHSQSIQNVVNARAEQGLVQERYAQVLAAQSALEQAQAALGLAQNQVSETILRAPFDGYVISHNFEDGDLIQPGSAVMTVGDLVHPYAYVYVAESDLPRVKTGTKALVRVDGIPGRSFTGTVTEISDTAEFTPENVQTKEERIEYLVFRVKIQFTDTTGLLKPGLPIDAVIPT